MEVGCPRYVGKTERSTEMRLKEHLFSGSLCKDTDKNRWLKSLLSRGLEPVIHPLQKIPDGYHETWQETERKWIMLFRLMGYPLTNLTDGGEGARKGHSVSEKVRETARARMLGNPVRKGQTNTPEHNEKISASLLGHIVREDTRLKISQTLQGYGKGVPKSLETRARMCVAQTVRWARYHQAQKELSEKPEECQ